MHRCTSDKGRWKISPLFYVKHPTKLVFNVLTALMVYIKLGFKMAVIVLLPTSRFLWHLPKNVRSYFTYKYITIAE